MVIITSKYVKPLDVIDSLLADHRKFLKEYYSQSKFICSGPQNPRVGGRDPRQRRHRRGAGDHEKRPLHDPRGRRVQLH